MAKKKEKEKEAKDKDKDKEEGKESFKDTKPMSSATRPREAPAEPCPVNSWILSLKSAMIWGSNPLSRTKFLGAFQIR